MKKAGGFLLHEIYGESYVHQQKKTTKYIYIYNFTCKNYNGMQQLNFAKNIYI